MIKQLHTYCAWRPDTGCIHVDAFSINWGTYAFYAFLPFSLVSWCVQKIIQDKAKGFLGVRLWTTQPWFALVLQLLWSQPWVIPPARNLLQHPSQPNPHPLHQNLHLMVCPLSGIPSDNLDFLGKPQKSSWHHGGVVPRNSIRHTSKNGWHFLLKGTSITVYQKLVRHFGSL